MAVEEHAVETAGHAASGIHVALSAERLGTFLGIPITNTLITSWLVIGILVIMGLLVGRGVKLVPSRIQALFETMFEFVYDYATETLGSREMAHRFFPLLMTVFLFVLLLNWFEFLPGVGSLTYNGHPFFRGANTDLTVPLVLAVVSFLVIEVTGIMIIGAIRYGGKFFQNPFRSPIGFVIGMIELVGEMVRIVSLSFRLFGNILAGAVIISVATFFAPYGAPGLLMIFEIFIGTLQAAIFSLLTLFFIKLAIEEPHGEEAH